MCWLINGSCMWAARDHSSWLDIYIWVVYGIVCNHKRHVCDKEMIDWKLLFENIIELFVFLKRGKTMGLVIPWDLCLIESSLAYCISEYVLRGGEIFGTSFFQLSNFEKT